jgi:hypothetical protein
MHVLWASWRVPESIARGGVVMAKKIGISLKPVVAELDKVQKELRAAKVAATPAEKKAIEAALKAVLKLKHIVRAKCHGAFTLVSPGL